MNTKNRLTSTVTHPDPARTETRRWDTERMARDRGKGARRRILAAIDFSPASLKALDHALVLAECLGAELILVHVLDPIYTGTLLNAVMRDRVRETAREREGAKLRDLVGARASAASVKFVIREGVPEYEILDLAANTRPDLIVLGRQVRNGLRRALVGSVSEDVADLATCPVLVVNNEAAPACW